MHKLTVLIINFNGAHFFVIVSLILLVIVYASSDDSLSLKQYENQIELIVNDQNVGFLQLQSSLTAY